MYDNPLAKRVYVCPCAHVSKSTVQDEEHEAVNRVVGNRSV